MVTKGTHSVPGKATFSRWKRLHDAHGIRNASIRLMCPKLHRHRGYLTGTLELLSIIQERKSAQGVSRKAGAFVKNQRGHDCAER
jgi:hypothetical protein